MCVINVHNTLCMDGYEVNNMCKFIIDCTCKCIIVHIETV